MLPEEIKYTEDHEWVSVEAGVATVGITEYATEELGEIVFVELPEVGGEFGQMDEVGSLESVKTVSSLYIPVSGSILEINEILEKNASTINEAPFGDGWLFKVKISDVKEYEDLMSYEDYKTFIDTL